MTNVGPPLLARKAKMSPRGIFLAGEAKGLPVEWQAPRPVTLDLVNQIAFECFLCGSKLSTDKDAENRATDEDVFPQWLQRDFNVADKCISMADGSERKFSELLVPACGRCNNNYLSRIENRIKRALDGGFARFSQLRKADTFLWCAKIYYGLIYHQVRASDWRAPTSHTPQLPESWLKDVSFLLDLLQGFRKRVMVYGPRRLFSVLYFPLQAGFDRSKYFRPAYNILFPCVALQLGCVGILCVLDDFGTTENAYRKLFQSTIGGKALHPIQFWELVGRLSYLSWIMPFSCSYFLAQGAHDIMIDLAPVSLGEHPHDPEEEARWLHDMTGQPQDCFFQGGRSRTLLMRPDRSFNEILIENEDVPEKV
jgi:hypothetical protein